MKRLLFACLLSISASVLAQSLDPPLHNWTVPPYARSSGGMRTMTDATPPRVFVGLQPCRVADTRGNGAPIQGGIFTDGQVRTWDLTGICGLPVGVDAISANFTVTGSPAAPPGAFLLAWPTGGPVPPVSILNYQAGQTLANAAIVPVATGEQINVNVSHSTHVIMDVNGYFAETLGTPENFLRIDNSSSQYAILAQNASLTCTGPCGIRGNISSTAGAHAVSGYALGTTGVNFGVYGETDTTTSGGGQLGTEAGGVRGVALVAGAAPIHGVIGETHSSSVNAAGVLGKATTASASGGIFYNTGAGVVSLATQGSGINYGVLTTLRLLGGSLDIVGLPKNFVSPHPHDPALEIRYASVEAPTVDVYFRGTANLVNGSARIEVPDHFRFTAREGTYMTELTPVGRPIALSVEEEGPEGIVVRGTGNARFHYVVYAERAEIVGYQPVTRNTTFSPEFLERLGGPEKLPESTRALLVKNGTINPDGSYNVETARAQGWTIPERVPPPASIQP